DAAVLGEDVLPWELQPPRAGELTLSLPQPFVGDDHSACTRHPMVTAHAPRSLRATPSELPGAYALRAGPPEQEPTANLPALRHGRLVFDAEERELELLEVGLVASSAHGCEAVVTVCWKRLAAAPAPASPPR